MFEKEAEEYTVEHHCKNCWLKDADEEHKCTGLDFCSSHKDWQRGAEFGYNKALEEQCDKIESAYREGVAFGKDKLIEQMKCCANCMFSESDRLNGTFCHKEGCYVLSSGKCNLWEF